MAQVARGYPTAYRPAAGGYSNPGFQRGAPLPPRPANDNLPKPANDNLPSSKPAKAALTALRGLGMAARFHPYVRAANLALDLYELYRAYGGRAAQPGGWNLSGWEAVCSTGGPRETLWPAGFTCGVTAIAQDHQQGQIYSGNALYYYASFWQNAVRYFADYKRGTVTAVYRAPKTAPVEVPVILPDIAPLPAIWVAPAVPMVPPVVDPMALPIGKPVPTPRPLPWRAVPARRTNPWRSPREQTQRGYAVPIQARGSEYPAAGPTLELSPHGTRQIKPEHQFARPPSGTKERKFAAGLRIGLIGAVNAVTETKDAVEAIHEALPKKAQAKRNGHLDPSLQAMIGAIYDNFDELDVPQAIQNLIANQIEDAIIGRANRATRHLDATMGYGPNRPGSGFGGAL